MDAKRNELAPCGIYCGACPAYFRKCFGCSSEIREQERIGKWACAIRKCCYEKQRLAYCIECGQFPCKSLSKKLTAPHIDEKRFAYRREIIANLSLMKKLGQSDYLERQRTRWRCKECGQRIVFYYYKCGGCGKEFEE